jgi:hypothetical protein
VEHRGVPTLNHAKRQKTLFRETNQDPFVADSLQQDISVCQRETNGNVHIWFQDHAALPVLVQRQTSQTLK